MDKKRWLTVIIILFVDLLGFGLILPLLRFYVGSYGATPLVVGLLTASYAAAQFIAAPVMGRLSDRYGRRPTLLLSIGPLVGGLLAWLGAGAPGLLCAILMVWLVTFVWRHLVFNPDPPLPRRGNKTAAQGTVQAHP